LAPPQKKGGVNETGSHEAKESLKNGLPQKGAKKHEKGLAKSLRQNHEAADER
jgi:hypothetical protein